MGNISWCIADNRNYQSFLGLTREMARNLEVSLEREIIRQLKRPNI